ncbi:MAG TPA: pyruvate dehydrogenase complex E1 component subunit beta [Oligoflexia bacterium]|nr:pyruvate dehydrogenase complex E1 component subunit beta [Oligoflexia bacterium]HMP26751.1 pyruvate dehydrogenase complex E1 component subunit beta [Oligoflexia bacterium]
MEVSNSEDKINQTLPNQRELAIRDALREAMEEEMLRDERVFLMGEEVGSYDGAYKCSRGMLEKFGPKRVIDAPIAECGFAGVGIGAAMAGLRPIIEFMTFNFSLIAIDQIINTAAKARLMSAGRLSCPIVFRGAGGAAFQLAAQHANSFESFYAYTPGLIVLAPATPYDMKGLLKSAIRDDNPVVFFESELTYSLKGVVPEGEYLVPIGKADLKREGNDLTIISWSKNVFLAEKVADELVAQGVECDLLDLRSLRPLDKEAIFKSVSKTHRVLIIQEQHLFASYGAFLSHLISTEIFDELDAPVGLVSSLEVPMPYSKSLESVVMPSKDRCLKEAWRVLEGVKLS